MAGPNVLHLPGPSRNWAAERSRLNDPRRDGLTTAEKAVLDAIEVHIGDHDEGWPTQGRIARQTSLCDRQVRRVVDSLVAQGFLEMRLVASASELPRGGGARGQRIVYRRGPRLLGPPVPGSGGTRVHAMSGQDVLPGQEVRRTDTIPGHGVRPSADMVSDKGSEKFKIKNSPKAPTDWDLVNTEGATRVLEALGGGR
jgi:hypothetical protein